MKPDNISHSARQTTEEAAKVNDRQGPQSTPSGSPNARRSALATPIRPKSAPLGNTVPLVKPVVMATAAGYKYRLIATSSTEGLLEPVEGAPTVRPNTPWQLIPQEPALGHVRAVVQMVPTPSTAPPNRVIRVCWLAITATSRRAYLVAALDRLLGVRAKVCVRDDTLGPNRKLVYHPRSRRVELVNTGGGVASRDNSKRRTPTSHRSAENGAGSEASPSVRPTSRPFVLVESGAMSDVHRSMLESGRYRAASRRTLSSWVGTTLKTESVPRPVTLRREQRQAQQTVVRCAKNRGCFTHAGQVRGMNCGWLGATHLVFETLAGAARGLTVGSRISVGVSGSPLYSQVVWVSGDIASIDELPSGRVSVEVDLRCLQSLPRQFAELVKYWRAQSDASSNP